MKTGLTGSVTTALPWPWDPALETGRAHGVSGDGNPRSVVVGDVEQNSQRHMMADLSGEKLSSVVMKLSL